MSFYFRPKKRTRRRQQLAAPAGFFEQLLARHAAQSEGQDLFDQRVDLARAPACDLADHLLDSAKDAIGGDARVARTYQVHLHAKVQRALDGVGDTLVELQDLQI